MFKKVILAAVVLLIASGVSCRKKPAQTESRKQYRVKLMTLDPGHFHAALVQRAMYDEVSPVAYVYSPAGAELDDHLNRIDGFNRRTDNPTSWIEKVYTGDDFLEKLLAEKPGNVVVLSGNNRKKAEYSKACVDAGLNVLADKPMCINAAGFDLIEDAFNAAAKNGTLLYDIMTERSEITTILQKEIVNDKVVFGKFVEGSADDPAVVKESVHHFYKSVSGSPLKRPGWFFDTAQQGEGIVDVTTHLLDLVMWECFPNEPIDYHTDIEVLKGKRWPTLISREQFKKVTGLDDFPDYLKERLDAEHQLPCYANGEIIFQLKGIHTKVSVVWNFEAPQGAGDTHYSIIKGTRANVIIKQGEEQNYKPELYVEASAGGGGEWELALINAVVKMQESYPGVRLEQQGKLWRFAVPDEYRMGHEAHFSQVMERFLVFMAKGEMPDWEIANMKAKYYTTTKALEMAGK